MKRNITYTLYLALFWLKLRYSAIEYDTVVVFVRVSVYAYVYMLAAEYNLTKVNSTLLYIHLDTSAAILSLSCSLPRLHSLGRCVYCTQHFGKIVTATTTTTAYALRSSMCDDLCANSFQQMCAHSSEFRLKGPVVDCSIVRITAE